LVGDEEDLVLDCYRLARWYHQSPEHFLGMPIDEVRMHMSRTLRLADLMRRSQQQQQPSEGEDG
jgi:hypothetical protein